MGGCEPLCWLIAQKAFLTMRAADKSLKLIKGQRDHQGPDDWLLRSEMALDFYLLCHSRTQKHKANSTAHEHF